MGTKTETKPAPTASVQPAPTAGVKIGDPVDVEMPTIKRGATRNEEFHALVQKSKDGKVRPISGLSEDEAKKFSQKLRSAAESYDLGLQWRFDDRPPSETKGCYLYRLVPIKRRGPRAKKA